MLRAIFFLVLLLTAIVFPQTVIVQQGENARNLAEKYLGNSNLWPEILKVNNLNSPADIKAGMQLTLPASQIKAADTEINKALAKMQEATAAGARILVPDLIQSAITLHNRAVELKSAGDWDNAVKIARRAYQEALNALNESLIKNTTAVEATLNEKVGTVESRTTSDVVWLETQLYENLKEGQKVRTLSRSYAEIIFQDKSKLRLSANSQAVIQRMRETVINRKADQTINIVEGDIYALLSGNKRRGVTVNIPGVEAQINSNNFWISRDAGNNIRIANYDGEINIKQGNNRVTIGKNKGISTSLNNVGGQTSDLLTETPLVTPENSKAVYRNLEKNGITFNWNKVKGAKAYWLEIAYESSTFNYMVYSNNEIRDTFFTVDEVANDGIYYWRIYAIDDLGLPGPTSEIRFMKVVTDYLEPFFVINYPAEGQILRNGLITITGETENDSKLYFMEKEVPLNSSGGFQLDLALKPGENLLVFTSIDEAGNKNIFKRKVIFEPDKNIEFNLAQINNPGDKDSVIQFTGNFYTIAGYTLPKAIISIKELISLFTARTRSDDSTGSFGLTVPVENRLNQYAMTVTTVSGQESYRTFNLEKKNASSGISFDNEIPSFTSDTSLGISGAITNASILKLNGMPVKLINNRFSLETGLIPGKNLLEFYLLDEAGNVSTVVKQIFFDNGKPEIGRPTLNFSRAEGGETIEISIPVKDISQLQKTADYELNIGDKSFKRILTLNESGLYYFDVFIVPLNVKGAVQVSNIEVKDIFGNTNIR